MQTIHYNTKPDKVVTWSALAIKQQSNILPILLPLAISYSFFYRLLLQAWLRNKYFFSKTFVIKGRLENWVTFEGDEGIQKAFPANMRTEVVKLLSLAKGIDTMIDTM